MIFNDLVGNLPDFEFDPVVEQHIESADGDAVVVIPARITAFVGVYHRR